jgi:hypothetical protein
MRVQSKAEPDADQPLLQHLRGLIQSASTNPIIGRLEMSIKWGEESYTPIKPKTGSSVRLQPRANGKVALMFICTTRLVTKFRSLYPNLFETEGERAVVFSPGRVIPDAEVLHIISLAFTHKLRA